jgi:hypothetical protein
MNRHVPLIGPTGNQASFMSNILAASENVAVRVAGLAHVIVAAIEKVPQTSCEPAARARAAFRRVKELTRGTDANDHERFILGLAGMLLWAMRHKYLEEFRQIEIEIDRVERLSESGVPVNWGSRPGTLAFLYACEAGVVASSSKRSLSPDELMAKDDGFVLLLDIKMSKSK